MKLIIEHSDYLTELAPSVLQKNKVHVSCIVCERAGWTETKAHLLARTSLFRLGQDTLTAYTSYAHLVNISNQDGWDFIKCDIDAHVTTVINNIRGTNTSRLVTMCEIYIYLKYLHHK